MMTIESYDGLCQVALYHIHSPPACGNQAKGSCCRAEPSIRVQVMPEAAWPLHNGFETGLKAC